MESTSIPRKRIRNRKRKRHGKTKRLQHDRLKVEVRSSKRQKSFAGCSVYVAKDKLLGKTMEAKSFWENYTTAQQWQQTHSVIWWRTRCNALEQENQVLRDTVRILARRRPCNQNEMHSEGNHQCHSQVQNEAINEFQNKAMSQFQDESRNQSQDKASNQFQNEAQNQFQDRAWTFDHTEAQSHQKKAEAESEPASDDESLEFELNDDMMDFLKQSMQHKLELKQKREVEASEREEEEKEVSLQGGAAWLQERTENAKLLYGEASPRILGMETALQTTIDRHKNKARPQYWPNIPLKL